MGESTLFVSGGLSLVAKVRNGGLFESFQLSDVGTRLAEMFED